MLILPNWSIQVQEFQRDFLNFQSGMVENTFRIRLAFLIPSTLKVFTNRHAQKLEGFFLKKSAERIPFCRQTTMEGNSFNLPYFVKEFSCDFHVFD